MTVGALDQDWRLLVGGAVAFAAMVATWRGLERMFPPYLENSNA